MGYSWLCVHDFMIARNTVVSDLPRSHSLPPSFPSFFPSSLPGSRSCWEAPHDTEMWRPLGSEGELWLMANYTLSQSYNHEEWTSCQPPESSQEWVPPQRSYRCHSCPTSSWTAAHETTSRGLMWQLGHAQTPDPWKLGEPTCVLLFQATKFVVIVLRSSDG